MLIRSFRVSALALGVLLAGCATVGHTGTPRVIVTPEQAVRWHVDSPLMPEGPYWMPSPSQVRAFEHALTREIGSPEARSYPGTSRHLRAYGRQYVGVVREGQRVIYANGFCDWEPPMPDPEQGWVSVLDGGGCFFGATFNPDTGYLDGPGFNGFAATPHNLRLQATLTRA